MSYKKVEPRLVELNDLASDCGLFTGDTNLNNGYGCKSRSKHKDEPGKCYSWDCPLAYEASLSDIKKHDVGLYEEHLENFKEAIANGCPEGDCIPASQYREDLMIQYCEI